MNSRRFMGAPSSTLGPDITTPLRKNAAVHHSKNCALMSQMGHQRPRRAKPYAHARPLCPESGQTADHLVRSALCHNRTRAVQQRRRYSITSSASASKLSGIVRPSALAVELCA
jgi:hypothetical protein